ncbi:MAG: DUF3365 domain-containing protein [Pirellulales bacterium]|jgi:hypothetical protein|nr:DUF3365 domain-containing protein [Pirellulales bacterium]
MKRSLSIAAAALLVSVAVAAEKAPSQPDEAAVDRARKTVRMLDDVYKNAVVLITEKYVHDEDDFAAGSAAVALFEAVSQKGHHKVELLDATGEPYDEENTASDDFEKEGIKQLNDGKDYFERVEITDGKPVLRAVTALPVVLQKCTMCHENYKSVKEGHPIGALGYSIPIE